MNDVSEAMLDAVVERIMPEDDGRPGASAAGTRAYVAERLRADPASAALVAGGLDRMAALPGPPFVALAREARDAVLAGQAQQPWFRLLAEWVAEGFYADPGNGGNAGGVSWGLVGYDPRLPPATGPARPLRATRLPLAEDAYDVIVVGAGAGGGVVACVLAEAGKRVLLLERGRDIGRSSLERDHLRNQRLSAYGHNAGPDIEGDPRVLVHPDGREIPVRPHEPGYGNNAAAVGSGTVVYGAQAWRFLPDDFRMASRYGVPEGSSLPDWPITYDDLEPYYERAEYEIGVAGTGAGHGSPRRRPHPMPPVPGYASRRVLTRGAEALGWSTTIPPLLINTVSRDGRPACGECGSCVGFGCPVDAKNGTQNTVMVRALATGRCTLVTEAMVTRIDVDARGKATGVTCVDASAPGAEPQTVRARAVVLCGGAVETARLMLNSACSVAPHGLGNGHDLVGRNYQGHYSPMVYGQFSEPIYDPRGPGVTTATTDFNHGNPGVIGGSMIADDFIMLPVIFWKRAMPPGSPWWGLAGKDAMRAAYPTVTRLYGPVQEITTAASRVGIDRSLRDRFGLPVARIQGVVHPESMRTAAFIRDRAEEWLRAAGAARVWSGPLLPVLAPGQHQAGTCRMGTDPANSVTDPYGRVWGHENLFVADGSLHPTNGGFNPVLTIMALAFRTAGEVARHA
jgi:choline dehydrogenase-like flavoprotein